MHSRSSRSFLLAGLGALAATSASAQTVLIADDFEVDTSASYTVVDDGTPDGTVAFAFDYLAAGIPLAPRSAAGDLGGLRLTANDTIGSADAYTVFHNSMISEPHYRMTVDVFMNFMGASGSTEYGHVGVGGDGTTFNSVFTPISGSGAFLAFTGDGGSGSSDYRWFRDPANTPAGDTANTTLPNSHPSYLGHGSRNSDPFFQALFPSPPATVAGSPGNIWTTVEIDVNNVGGVVSFFFDGVLTYQGEFAGAFDGHVNLGLADVFSSLSASNNFTLYDNLIVETVEAGLVCSQSFDSTALTPGGSVHCNSGGISVANQWLRRYSPLTDCGLAGDMVVTDINFGVNQAIGAVGIQTVFARVYSIPTGAPLIYSNLTLLSEEAVEVVDQDFGLLTAKLGAPALIPVGSDLVLEIAKTTDETAGDVFIPGGNTLGQTADNYVAAVGCGISEPTPLSAIGFPDAHLVLDPVYRFEVGTAICSPATANSTGNPAHLFALGSDRAVNNDLNLYVSDLPLNSNGFFLTSQEVNILPNPGGVGDICIASFTIGRYNSATQNSGTTGRVCLELDLTSTPFAAPMGNFGTVVVMMGETRYWQYWYRDTNGMGGTTSNFSDAVCITFQ